MSHASHAAISRPLNIAAHLSRIVFAFGAFALSVSVWLSSTWSDLSTDEVVFHLMASVEGTDTTVIWSYCLRYLSVVLIACAVILFCHRMARHKGALPFRRAVVATALLGFVLGGYGLWNFSNMVDLKTFLSFGTSDGDFMEEHFVNANDVQIEFPEKKRNLIYIYLESMETTFADQDNGGAWNENLIPELTKLGQEGEDFSGDDSKLDGGYVLPGTAWTMGAMFGMSSGTPLKLPFYGNFISEEMTDFFPGIPTIGDLLEDEGYRQCLMIGSDAAFGSRDAFYEEHGNYELYDYTRAKQDGFIDPDYKVFWGFEDEKLFEWGKKLLKELAASDQPFNLTMLTVDTHFEDGYICRLCDETEHGDNQYANVMSCSSRQVEAFVRWIQKQDFYENTTVVICGDHTTMDTDFCKQVKKDYQRRTYTTILNSAASREDPHTWRFYSTLDLFPTTLAALGATIEGNRLGLGTNLYSTTPTIVEEYGLETCDAELQRMSLFLDQFSDETKLGDAMIESLREECALKYDDGTLGFGGFLLGDMEALDATMIEDSRLEVFDDRTGKTTSYPMIQWTSDEVFSHHASRDLTHYYLGTRLTLDAEDLAHTQATAYVTIEGYEEQAFGSWPPEEDADAESADTKAAETKSSDAKSTESADQQ